MCDYSMHNVASRPAKVGDRLVSTRFTNSITGGFASVDDPHVAVCLLPGTELAFEENVAHERSYGLIFLAPKWWSADRMSRASGRSISISRTRTMTRWNFLMDKSFW